ncbi:MAG: FlgD immunoglobulin-like domain containing protein, partial [Candidatus Cloacimonadaceae bacterium]|nr:FlgD immunoglobulin-like domain containing protein [Candidatus Cloacimonadaceae bacterium]
PNGSAVVDETYPANTQVISHAMVVDTYGTYVAYITAIDNAGNQGMNSVSFMTVTGSAPTVTFDPMAGGSWWLNNTANNALTFTIDAAVSTTVSASFYAIPSGDIISGPTVLNPVAGVYTANLHGTQIPADASAIKLVVTVTDMFGYSAEYTQVYNVDKVAPTIVIFSPEAGSEYILVDATTQVNLYAEFADLMVNRGKSKTGSGIASARVVMTNPLGAVSTIATAGAGATELSHVLDNLMLGAYSVRLIVTDNAGNQASATTTFVMSDVPLPPPPPVTLAIGEAYVYPNPMTTDLGAKFSIEVNTTADITVRIYDFAGREVRTLVQYASSKSVTEISWDGKNNNGQKLARGAYFARVTANDGKKIVEKVVKVAITK